MARRRRGHYKMTPRRRAALKKAQAASARKRRFQGLKNFGNTALAVGGTVAAGAALYHLEGYARDPGKAVRHITMTHNFLRHGRATDPNAPKMRRPQPLNRHRIGPIRPIRNGVAGKRISNRQRRVAQGRLF